MSAVLAANSSSADADSTTDHASHGPPNELPSSDTNALLWVCLTESDSPAVAITVRSGDVTTTVITTRSMAYPAVRRIGSRMAGESWLMLSSPENASHAPANPASALCA